MAIQLNDVLITEELSRRSSRQPNLHAENQAMRSLARQLAQTPERMLQHLVDLAVELCDAGTAGVSLVEPQPDGEAVFRWVAMAGLLASYVGGCTPCNFSPCGVCLEQGASVLFAYPERYFTYLQTINPPLVEGLVLPLIADGQALGTLWIATHDEQRQFDGEDVRLMTGLADFTVTLLRTQQQARELLVVGTALKEEVTERKRAEEWAQALINNLPGGAAFVVDRDLRYLLAAGEALGIAGFEPKDFIGRTIFEVLPSDLAASYELLYRQALAGESFEHEHQSHDRWYVSRGTPLLAENGKIYAVLAVSYDITDRKKTEAALQEAETRFRQVFDNNMVAIGIWTPAGAITDANDALLDLIGYTRPDLEVGAIRWSELTPPEYHNRDQQAVAEVKAKGACIPYEKEFIHKDGHRQPILIGSGRFDDRTGTGIFCAFDISDRKQAEAEREQLLANERHYANQLQGLTSAALAINSALSVEEVLQIITDQAAAIIRAHQSVTSLTISQNWAQAINAVYLSDKYAAWRDYEEQPDGSGIYACVCHLNRPMRMTQAELEAHPHWKGFGKESENHLPMRGWLAAPLVGHDGHNIGLIQLSDKYEGEFTQADESILVQLASMASVAVENARLYEAEQQARAAAEAAREEAQAANRIKDEFLAVLSHELRSPLNPILGWSTLLQTKKLDEAKTAQALATVQRNAKLQSELIEDLLDVSRILRGKLALNVAPVNLASTLQAAMETVRLAAEAKSIQLEAILAPNVGLVSGDVTRLQQVMWNLLSNAVKFTPEGGQVHIRLEQLDSWVQLTVSDTGQGIALDFLPYVFDTFRQADGATTRKFGGLGLGLAIVRHLVELHGGTIGVESQGEGMGAMFTLRLPLMPTQAETNLSKTEPEYPLDLSEVKILVVDDDADTREYIAFLLEQAGAKVTAAASASEALTLLTQSKLDLLLSDIGMPEMDGYMLLRQIRSLPSEQGGTIPAIALSAYAGEINQQQAIAAGFQRHIAKPVEPEELIRAITSLTVPHRPSSNETG